MISDEYKCIFVHIEKTGGSSIENAFDQPDLYHFHTKHITAKGYKKMYPEKWDYFKFSFVRNPWDLIVSMHHYFGYDHSSFKELTKWKLLGGKRLKHLHASDYILPKSNRIFNKENKGCYAGWGWWMRNRCQTDLLLDERGNICVDYIGKFESLQDDFNSVCLEIGKKPQQLPWIHKTNHRHYSQYYDEELKKIVARKFERDIDFFKYSFVEK